MSKSKSERRRDAQDAAAKAEAAQRDQLWNMTWQIYYRSAYNAILADKLADKWRAFDNIAKISAAFTATGSAVAGWALWTSGYGKIAWAIIAGIGVVVSIIYTSLGVPTELKDWIECKHVFSQLELDLESFRDRMKFDRDFPVPKFADEFNAFRVRYGQAVQKIPGSGLMTAKLKSETQHGLDERLGKEG